MNAAKSVETVQDLFQGLWTDYIEFNPEAKVIYDLILKREKSFDAATTELVNDHIALRTYGVPGINIKALSAIVKGFGYKEAGEYVFEEKKLFARHFEHADERKPKIFISELEIEKLSPMVQKTALEAAQKCSAEMLKDPAFLWSGRHWNASYATYHKLLTESEYAAWMYAFGFRCNHFTVHFNYLKSFAALDHLNAFVKSSGYPLNQAGGEIKGSKEVFLEQSSTLASKTLVQFDEGVYEIPSTYYEFARRYPLPNGKLYQGFVAASADKIFESINVHR